VGLERGPLSLVGTTEELLGRKSSGSGLENRECGRWGSVALTTQKLALTSPTSGGRPVGIVCWQTQATDFVGVVVYNCDTTSETEVQVSSPGDAITF
jgi:hypothetical protein